MVIKINKRVNEVLGKEFGQKANKNESKIDKNWVNLVKMLKE